MQALTNALIYTVDEACTTYLNGTIVFDENIIAVGPADEIDIPTDAQVIDAKGRYAVLPGLIDCHTHSSLLKGYSENAQLMDWLPAYQREHQALTPEHAYYAFMVTYLESLKGGVTQVMDMYRHLQQSAKVAAELGMRVHLVPYAADHETKTFFETLETTEALIQQCHNQREGMTKVWMGLEHITYCSETMFRAARELADQHQIHIHTHTSEQQEEVAVVQQLFGDRPVHKFNDWGILKPGSVLAHCVWLDDAEIAVLADTGTGVAHCPTSNMKLASGAAPLLDFFAAGITVGLGSDGGISNNSLDMFECMKMSSLLQKVTHLDATAVTAEQALRMATSDAAKLLNTDTTTGSLTAGKQADIIMIDLWQPHLLPIAQPPADETEPHDPVLWNLVFAARASDVKHVWVKGKQVIRDGYSTQVDEAAMLEAINSATIDLLQHRSRFKAIPMV